MPMEFSIPQSVSATRGTGLPMRRLGVTLFVTTAPRRARSMAFAYSCAKQPDAGEAHPHGAGHLLLERNLAARAEPLQHRKEPVRSAGVDHIGRVLLQ